LKNIEVYNYNFIFGDWLQYRNQLLTDVFFKLEKDITVKNIINDYSVFHRTITKTCFLSEIVNVNFDTEKVAILFTSFTPQLIFEQFGKKFIISNQNFSDSIVFNNDVRLNIIPTKYQLLTPVYATFFIIPKKVKLEKYEYLREYPIKTFFKKENNVIYQNNSCIIDNNSENTVIFFIDGGMYLLNNVMENLNCYPYVSYFAKKYKCNCIGIRHDNPNNWSLKFGLKGYPPLTSNSEETVDYLKSVLKKFLPKTKKLYTLSWCLGNYDALNIGEKLNCNSIWLFDFFICNLLSIPLYTSFFENTEKKLLEEIIGKTAKVDNVIFSGDSAIGKANNINIDILKQFNSQINVKKMIPSELIKPAHNLLEMCIFDKVNFFSRYL